MPFARLYRAARLCLACAVTILLAASLPANAAPEVQANTSTRGEQIYPEIAKLSNGYVVVWISERGSEYEIFGQRYNLNGVKAGGQIRISGLPVKQHSTGQPKLPDVAGLADGGFVVVWIAQGPRGENIYAALFTARGEKRGGDVKLGPARSAGAVRVAGRPDGGFVVVWNPQVGETAQVDIYGRLYDADARPAGDEFGVNPPDTIWQGGPLVASLLNGHFVVVWRHQDSIYGQRYNAAGRPLGDNFRVNRTFGLHTKTPTGLSALSDGGFVVVWGEPDDFDGEHIALRGQRFSPTAAWAGSEFAVTTQEGLLGGSAGVSAFSDGGFVAVWVSAGADSWDVYGQAFDAAGATSGDEFRLSTTTLGDQMNPVVAADSEGRFMAAWESPDADGPGIFTRRFTKPIE